MPSVIVPELDPEWLEKVEPFTPKTHPGTIQETRDLMTKLDAVKVTTLNESMPDLKEGLVISNIMVAMRDGVQREMRIFRPQGDAVPAVYLG
jgi:predicted acyl esterase